MTAFTELRDRVFEHYSRGAYREALGLCEDFQPADPSQDEDLHFWRMCLRSRLGETDEALATFSAALDRGYWWSEAMLADSDLDPLRELPQWGALLQRSRELQAQARPAEAAPVVLPASGGGDRGALVVLHGAGSRPQVEAEAWRAATEAGWTLVAPQSTQRLSGSGRYGWHDLERATAHVVGQLEEGGFLSGTPLVLGGFSQGGGLAAHLVCGGTVPARGLVVLGPTFGDWGIPEDPAGNPVRSRILLGEDEHPPIAQAVEDLAGVLQGAGWPVEVERIPGLGHAHPPDFGDRLVDALAWVALESQSP